MKQEEILKELNTYYTDKSTNKYMAKKLFDLFIVSQRSELLFCDFCKEDNPHKKHEHKKLKECEGCGLITKL